MIIAGIDEAGRGCLAGSVVAGAVILPEKYPDNFFKDSKKISEAKRNSVYKWIVENCAYGMGESSANEVDKLGIKEATRIAMCRAVENLARNFKQNPEKLLIDGNDKFKFKIDSEDFIRGDERIAEISAASIVAKVSRDKMLRNLGNVYPTYGFENHKGYGTFQHIEAIKMLGVIDGVHRKTYKPIKTFLTQLSLF